MNPVNHDEAVRLAVWVGELFTHLNETQVAEFREYFERCGYDADTIERGVRRYIQSHEFARIDGIADSMAVVRANDTARHDARQKQLAAEAELERAVDVYLADLTEAELYELREGELKHYPPALAARVRRKPVSGAGGIVRGVARGIVARRLAEENDAQQPIAFPPRAAP